LSIGWACGDGKIAAARKLIRGGMRIAEDDGAVSRRWRPGRCHTRVGHLVCLMGSTERNRLTCALEFENPHH
jgi:hypothetical protein